jgi:hypothetical protein
MKIIREGKLPDVKTLFRGECINCGCSIECTEEELSKITGAPRRPCPTIGCNCNISLAKAVDTAPENPPEPEPEKKKAPVKKGESV